MTFTYSGFVNGNTAVSTLPTISTTATVSSNVGTYPITLSGGSDPNYNITLENGTLTVGKADLTITADNKSKTYGSANPTLTFTYTGLVNGNTAVSTLPTISTTATASSNVGTYPITLSGGSDPNYNISLVNGTLTVDRAPLTITADNKSKTYGSANPTLTFTYTGLVNGNTAVSILPTISTTATASSNAGTYPITLSGGSDPNYNITLVNGTLTVERALLTITANSQTKVYGASDPTLTYSITSGSLLGSDVLSGSLTRAAGENVGTYAIAIGTLGNSNYTITLVSADFSITPKTLVITPNEGQSKLQAAADPILTYQASGWERSDNASLLTGALSRVAG
ncbi:MAG: MBG domain-containing protein, partial [Microcystis sp. LE19-196.1B]|nr:MBG domain-containing protein [Microcystis sp. LE19-196.1B]